MLNKGKAASNSRGSAGSFVGVLIAAFLIIAGGIVAAGTASAAEPWGFEQVTPPVKGDGALSYVDTFRSSDDGDSFLYTTQTPFSSVPTESIGLYTRYLGERGEDGWTNRAVDPPFDQSPFNKPKLLNQATLRTSENLDYSLVTTTVALTPGAIPGGSNIYMRNMRSGEMTLVAASEDLEMVDGMTSLYGDQSAIYVAPDGRTAVFTTHVALTPDAPQGLPLTSPGPVYKWTAADGLEVASVLPNGTAVSAMIRGAEAGARESKPMKGQLDYLPFQHFTGGQGGPVYVREGDETKLVSYSRRAGDDPTVPVPVQLHVVGAGGRYSLLVTDNNGLLTDDTPAEAASRSILYRYDAASDSLTYVGHSGSQVDLKIEEMTTDGETIAFQSSSVLDDGASAGAANLYVWHNGSIQLVNTFASGSKPATSGTYWLRKLSANGRYLAFTDDSTTTAQSFGINNISAACPTFGFPGACDIVYVYDSVTDELSCASCRSDGETPKGAAGDPDTGNYAHMALDTHATQFVSNDGTVFFTTKDDLLSGDVNGAPDVYAYHDGEQRLISRAAQGVSYTRFLEVTPNGETVFFATNDAIVGTDDDRAVDVYATGAGAGYPYTPPDDPPPCKGSECRDESDPLPVLPPAGSIDFQGGGNEQTGGKVVVHRTGSLAGSKIRLRVSVPSAGSLAVGGKKVKSKRKSVDRADSYAISTSLTKKARRQLRKKSQMKVPVRVSFHPQKGSASSLKFAVAMKANSKKKGR